MSTSMYFSARSQSTGKDPLEGKFACSQSPSDKGAVEEAIPLSRFAGQYWFVELRRSEHKALSTEEVASALSSGATARSISGPFPTREEAERSLERYWEMINDDDNG